MIRLGCKSVSIFAIYGFVTRFYETYHVARHAYNTHLPCCQNQTAPKIDIKSPAKIYIFLIGTKKINLYFFHALNISRFPAYPGRRSTVSPTFCIVLRTSPLAQ